MYTKRNYTYADPYKILEGNGIRAYQAKGDGYTEVDCPIDDLRVEGNIAMWGGGNIAFAIPERDYSAIKTKLIKLRYSYDDQIAIICNGDAVATERMQAWRDWASAVAKLICRRAGIKS